MGKNSSHGDSGVRVALTEADWWEKCYGNWDDTASGCKKMKKEKKEHCNYSSSDDSKDRDARTSDDGTSTPTGTPTITTSTPTSTPTSTTTRETTSKSGKSSKKSSHGKFEMFDGLASPRA